MRNLLPDNGVIISAEILHLGLDANIWTAGREE
jgi:hypothetical protein